MLPDTLCISLVGMAGAGKSTLAPLLADRLGWACCDTDRLIEAHYGRCLQHIVDAIGPEKFLEYEANVVGSLSLKRAVISTGGSVVYAPRAVERLKAIGPVVWLKVSRDCFLGRVGACDNRGFVRRGGRGLEEIFDERQPLYEQMADVTVRTDLEEPEESVARILKELERRR